MHVGISPRRRILFYSKVPLLFSPAMIISKVQSIPVIRPHLLLEVAACMGYRFFIH